LNGDEKKVYEFVVPAIPGMLLNRSKGTLTQVEVEYGQRCFKTSGLIVLERNYLDVYPYDKWESSQELPGIRPSATSSVPQKPIWRRGDGRRATSTEPELIALMDANGIGTDAPWPSTSTRSRAHYVQTRTGSAACGRGVQRRRRRRRRAGRPGGGRGRGRVAGVGRPRPRRGGGGRAGPRRAGGVHPTTLRGRA